MNATKKTQLPMKKMAGHAKGNCIVGVCAVSGGPHGVVALIANDIKTLEIAWNDISTVALDKSRVSRVAIFDEFDVTPVAGLPTQKEKRPTLRGGR